MKIIQKNAGQAIKEYSCFYYYDLMYYLDLSQLSITKLVIFENLSQDDCSSAFVSLVVPLPFGVRCHQQRRYLMKVLFCFDIAVKSF